MLSTLPMPRGLHGLQLPSESESESPLMNSRFVSELSWSPLQIDKMLQRGRQLDLKMIIAIHGSFAANSVELTNISEAVLRTGEGPQALHQEVDKLMDMARTCKLSESKVHASQTPHVGRFGGNKSP